MCIQHYPGPLLIFLKGPANQMLSTLIQAAIVERVVIDDAGIVGTACSRKMPSASMLRVLDLSHPFWHEVTPLQGTTRKIKSPHEIKKIKKSPHHWQITKAQHAQKFNRTLWYRSRISSCLCIMPNIRSQNQHLLISRPLAQQVRQSNPLKLLSYLSVLIQKGLHTLA